MLRIEGDREQLSLDFGTSGVLCVQHLAGKMI